MTYHSPLEYRKRRQVAHEEKEHIFASIFKPITNSCDCFSFIGIKCQQVGLGNLVKSASANGIPVTDIQRSGTFGGCRYFHRFQDLDSIIIDSSRENSSYNPSEHGNIPNIEGISLLRVWMDTWKSVGEFSYVSKSPLLSLEQRGAAVILAGPVVGTPISVPPTNSETQTSSSYTSSVYVPIMIEVDRGTILNVVIRNLFQGETTTMAYMVNRIVLFCKILSIIL